MRKACLECVLKHLGSAAVFIKEVSMGYPSYFGYVYGELDHAADECLRAHADLARVIREHRIKWAETRTSDNPHMIPFESLFAFIEVIKEAGPEAQIEVPEEVLAGLDKDKEGNVHFSMDTRP